MCYGTQSVHDMKKRIIPFKSEYFSWLVARACFKKYSLMTLYSGATFTPAEHPPLPKC